MSIQVVCQCGARFAARNELAGKQIECVTCGQPLQVPYPQVAAQPMPAPAQYQNQASPVYNPPPKGATGPAARWPIIATAMGAAGIAVAGGILFYTTNNRISGLDKTIGEQTATLETNLKDQISTVNNTVSEVIAVKAESEVLVKNVKVLSDKLEVESTAQIANQKKLEDLVKKTGTLRSEISAIDGNIAKEVATKSAGFETRIKDMETARTKLEGDFKDQLAITSGLQVQLNAHDAVIKGLDAQIKTEVTKLLPNMKPITDRLDNLESGATPQPVFKTVMAESNGHWVVYRLNTANGEATFWQKTGPFSLTRQFIAPPAIPSTVRLVNGRFDIKLRHDQFRNVRDAVLLDTQVGAVWRTTGFFKTWSRMGVPRLFDYGQNDAWRIEVDADQAVNFRPRVFLTDTRTNQVFVDDFSPNFMNQLF